MLFVIGVIAASLAAVAYGMSTALRALGARRVAQAARDEGIDDTNPQGGPTLASTMSTLVDPSFILGTILVVLGFAGGALAARFLPLFLSQTIVSGNLVVTALLGTIMLNIALHTRDWVAIWLVVFSLCLLGFSSSPAPGEGKQDHIHWGLFFTTIAVCVLALVVVYKLGQNGAILGGAISGLLFGIIAIAVRILDGVHPFDLSVLLLDPAAWTIAVAGAVGFFVQTVALQLGAVNGVTAALVVGETAGPSLVGVLVLGDSAKPGLGWLAIVGFIGAVIGAVLVAWYGSGDPDHFGEAPPLKGGWRRGREPDDDDAEVDPGRSASYRRDQTRHDRAHHDRRRGGTNGRDTNGRDTNSGGDTSSDTNRDDTAAAKAELLENQFGEADLSVITDLESDLGLDDQGLSEHDASDRDVRDRRSTNGHNSSR